MKVPPKRKGNPGNRSKSNSPAGLNESPSEKEGKFRHARPRDPDSCPGLNESPSEKEGKSPHQVGSPKGDTVRASMKVPPKRKGNYGCGDF